MNSAADTVSSESSTVELIFLGVAIAALFYLYLWLTSRCPACGKAWRNSEGRKWLNDSVQTKSETRDTGKVDSHGQRILYTAQVPYVTSEYLASYSCSGCGHEWTKIEHDTVRKG